MLNDVTTNIKERLLPHMSEKAGRWKQLMNHA